MGLSATESAVLDRIDPALLLARTEAWAAVNSGSRNLDGLATVAGLLADSFAPLPGAVALVDPAPVTAMDPEGREVDLPHGRHLTVTVRPHAPLQLLLTGHMDTVFGADHPFQSLRWIEAGVLNGPGVTDMKGGIAIMLAALEAIEASPVANSIGYQLMINSDEETGSLASAALIAELARGKAAALTYEPALPDGTLAGARGGTGNFSIRVTGRSAHAGRNPEDGRNALTAAADIALRLEALGGEDLTVNPARIDGGGPNNVVPDHAVLRVNFRPRSSAAIARTAAAIDRILGEVAAERGVDCHRHGGFTRPPKPIDAGAELLFALVGAAGADLGLAIGRRDTGGVCDGNNIAALGVPVVDTMGARGGAIHSADEYLIVDSLAERARLSALTMLRLAESGLKA